MIGSPSAGFSRLREESINSRASLTAFWRERDMHSHLVAVKVGIEGRGDQRVQLDGAALDQHRLKCLDTEAVQVSAHGSAAPDVP